jgi:hypothetical protein
MTERRARAQESKDIARYQAERAKYDAEHAAWRTQLDAAIESGDQVRAEALADIEPMPPDPPTAVTGDLEAGEVKASWDHDNDPSTPRIAETAPQTLDRLRKNNKAAYKALQATAQAAVEAGWRGSIEGNDTNAIIDEWLSANFGDMDPDERYEAMQLGGQRLADSKPKLAMPSGSRFGIGSPGRPKTPVPQGQQALDPRTGKPVIIRDPFNNSRVENVPIPAGGLLPTTRGNVQRAPQDQAALGALGVENLATFPVNPEAMTPDWRDQMLGIGAMAFGLNREDFAEGPEGDSMFIAATQKLLSKHQEKVGAGFVAVPEITGGYSYRPGPEMEGRRNVRAQQKEATRVKGSRMAGAAAIDPKTRRPLGELLDEAAAAGEAGRVRELTAQIRAADQSARTQGLTDARSIEATQKNLNNPNRAPGMLRESLRQAGDDPRAIAAVYRQFGMPEQAMAVLAMENQRFAIEQQAEVARTKAEAEREKNGLEIMRQSDTQIADGLLNPDATRPIAPETAIDEYARVHGAPDKPLSREQATDGVGRLLVQTRRPEAISHPVVQGVLDSIYQSIGWWRSDGPDAQGWVGKREMFISEAKRRLNMDEATAGQMYDRRAGRQAEPPAQEPAATEPAAAGA